MVEEKVLDEALTIADGIDFIPQGLDAEGQSPSLAVPGQCRNFFAPISSIRCSVLTLLLVRSPTIFRIVSSFLSHLTRMAANHLSPSQLWSF